MEYTFGGQLVIDEKVVVGMVGNSAQQDCSTHRHCQRENHRESSFATNGGETIHLSAHVHAPPTWKCTNIAICPTHMEMYKHGYMPHPHGKKTAMV